MHKLMAVLLLLAVPAGAEPVTLDARRWQQLSDASRAGFALADVTDKSRYQRADYWEPADATGGDCEDKALFARAVLRTAGWPAQSLRLAMVWTETGEYHTVLTVDVVRGGRSATYVIDNRFVSVVGWDTLSRHGYRWDRRQASTGHGWVRIAADASGLDDRVHG
jgi:predicted transglutaminase-like cysteine proteinase